MSKRFSYRRLLALFLTVFVIGFFAGYIHSVVEYKRTTLTVIEKDGMQNQSSKSSVSVPGNEKEDASTMEEGE